MFKLKKIKFSEKSQEALITIYQCGGRSIDLLRPRGKGVYVYSSDSKPVAMLIGETEHKLHDIFDEQKIYCASLEWVVNKYCQY